MQEDRPPVCWWREAFQPEAALPGGFGSPLNTNLTPTCLPTALAGVWSAPARCGSGKAAWGPCGPPGGADLQQVVNKLQELILALRR
jgi:hypothetical protein